MFVSCYISRIISCPIIVSLIQDLIDSTNKANDNYYHSAYQIDPIFNWTITVVTVGVQ